MSVEHTQFDPYDPEWTMTDQQRQAARVRAAERHRLALLVYGCLVLLAVVALWRMGPLPEGLL